MKRFYCTYFDSAYLPRAMALVESLQRHSAGDWVLFAICMDEESRDVLDKLALQNVTAISLAEIERADHELAAAKSNRNRIEYLWTTTPAIILWLISNRPEIDRLTYLDADLYFYSSPEPIFAEFDAASILIHEHRYAPELADMEINGKYNVGLLCFRRCESAFAALRWWRERCIESCELDIKSGKCGDQMYLNDWPNRFQGVHVLQHRGGGIAPWNVNQFDLRIENGDLCVDGTPVIFYHFHSLQIVAPTKFRLVHRFYLRPDVIELIYKPYTQALTAAIARVERVVPSFRLSFARPGVAEQLWDFVFQSAALSRGVAAIRQFLRQYSRSLAPNPG